MNIEKKSLGIGFVLGWGAKSLVESVFHTLSDRFPLVSDMDRVPSKNSQKKSREVLTKVPASGIVSVVRCGCRDGGIAQLARACGSYPQCPRFKSRCRYQASMKRLEALHGNRSHPTRPVGQVVKTRPFHGCNMGSNPVRVTTP